MKKNPVIPYALIAGIGILLVIVVSIIGIDQNQAIQDEEQGDGEQQEEQAEGDGSSGGETAASGEEIYQSNCASCHASDLSGNMGPALDTIGSDYSKDEIKEIIANGFPDAGMQPGIVQGGEADAVAEWLSEQK